MKIARITDWYRKTLLARLFTDQRGQVLPWTGFMILSMLGMGALALDFGRAYVCFHQLQSATDAAALAGAEQLPNSTYSSVANQYGAQSGDLNHYNWMSNVTTTVTGKCLSSLTSAGMACVSPANANALQVTSTFNVPTYFARLFGINQIPVSWTSTASMRGSTSIPYNVAIIMDTTASMNSTDSDSQCGSTRLSCGLSGIQTLLQNMAPCSSQLTSCGTASTPDSTGASNVPNPVDVVSLFSFPIATTATVTKDYDCSSTNPTITPYQYPTTSATSYAPPGPATNFITPSTQSSYSATYQVIGFSSDYKTLDATSTMNPNSNLVKAVNGKSGCTGMAAPGGEGTYYAGVIYAAQAALVAEQTARTGVTSQNVIIILSDGDATSTCQQMGASSTSCTSPAPTGATSGGTYPSWRNECHQAITAAQAAAAAGTHVYTVAYGSTSSGCTTDSPNVSPCSAMQQMASNSAYFYSDYTSSNGDGSCISTAQPTTNLTQIFTDIANSFTAARLIPNGTS